MIAVAAHWALEVCASAIVASVLLFFAALAIRPRREPPHVPAYVDLDACRDHVARVEADRLGGAV